MTWNKCILIGNSFNCMISTEKNIRSQCFVNNWIHFNNILLFGGYHLQRKQISLWENIDSTGLWNVDIKVTVEERSSSVANINKSSMNIWKPINFLFIAYCVVCVCFISFRWYKYHSWVQKDNGRRCFMKVDLKGNSRE